LTCRAAQPPNGSRERLATLPGRGRRSGKPAHADPGREHAVSITDDGRASVAVQGRQFNNEVGRLDGPARSPLCRPRKNPTFHVSPTPHRRISPPRGRGRHEPALEAPRRGHSRGRGHVERRAAVVRQVVRRAAAVGGPNGAAGSGGPGGPRSAHGGRPRPGPAGPGRRRAPPRAAHASPGGPRRRPGGPPHLRPLVAAGGHDRPELLRDHHRSDRRLGPLPVQPDPGKLAARAHAQQRGRAERRDHRGRHLRLHGPGRRHVRCLPPRLPVFRPDRQSGGRVQVRRRHTGLGHRRRRVLRQRDGAGRLRQHGDRLQRHGEPHDQRRTALPVSVLLGPDLRLEQGPPRGSGWAPSSCRY
jgi:hypothetical protein